MKRFLVLVLLAGGLWRPPAWGADPLQGPIDVARVRTVWGRPAPSTTCPVAPAAVRSLRPAMPASKREEDAAGGTLLPEYEAELGRLGDAYLQSVPPDGADASCVLAWLDRWAQQDSMDGGSGEAPHQTLNTLGAYQQEWLTVAAALNYLKIRDDPRLPAEPRQRVQAWLHRLGESIRQRGNPHKGNHHLYWAGAAVMLAGVISDDRRMFDWGIAAGNQGIKEITIEGYLPQELNRGTLASHYHYFAMLPLLLIADTAWRNGIDLYSQNGGGLHRLARLLMSMERNPQFLAGVVGLAQVEEVPGDGLRGAWWEMYHARFPYYLADFQDVERDLLNRRPYRYDWGGGNLTVEYGSPQ